MFHQVDRRKAIVFQILSRVVRFQFRALVFLFCNCRFHFKSGFFFIFGILMYRRNRIRNSRLKYHRYSFTLICRRRRLIRFCVLCRKLFLFFGLNIHHSRRRRSLLISPFQIEFYFLRLRSSKFRIIFACRNRLNFFFLFTFQETQSKKFAQPDNRARTDIYKEADSCYQQNHPHTGHTYLRNQPTADIVSVHSPQIDERILIMLHKSKSKENGEPDQQQGTSDKPFPQSYDTYTHQLQSCHSQKDKDKERRNSKTVVDQITGQLCSA